jgi:hypothetical protein
MISLLMRHSGEKGSARSTMSGTGMFAPPFCAVIADGNSALASGNI